MLIVSGSYQDYQNGAVSNQLTGGGGECAGGDRGGALYSVHATV
jgi:hypothetical protein